MMSYFLVRVIRLLLAFGGTRTNPGGGVKGFTDSTVEQISAVIEIGKLLLCDQTVQHRCTEMKENIKINHPHQRLPLQLGLPRADQHCSSRYRPHQ